jgi:hypothetical protein
VLGLSVSLACVFRPLVELAGRPTWFALSAEVHLNPAWLGAPWAMPLMVVLGVLLLTLLMQPARGVGHLHALFAKTLLAAPAAAQ